MAVMSAFKTQKYINQEPLFMPGGTYYETYSCRAKIPKRKYNYNF